MPHMSYSALSAPFFSAFPSQQRERPQACPLAMRHEPAFCAVPALVARRQTRQRAASCACAAPVPRRELLQLGVAAAGVALAGLAAPPPVHALNKKRILAKAGPLFELTDGVTYRDITVGKGYVPREGDTVAIHYSLFYDDLEVESSRESQGLAASPLGFTFGALSGPGSIMRGVNVGMDGMKVGGLRLITVPPALAFGEKGKLPLIPGDATVDFCVSLLSCKRAGTNANSVIDPRAQVF